MAAPTHAPIAPGRGRPLLILAVVIILIAAIFGVFGQTAGFDFVEWDDPTNVYENPYYQPVSAANIAHFWRHSYFELYMPVTYSLWALCARLGLRGDGAPIPREGGGMLPFSPAPFHLLNVIGHAACALLVFVLLLRLSRRFEGTSETETSDSGMGRVLAAAGGALLFALHPVQVESIAWVTGANNIISAFFGLLALHAYLTYAEGESRPRGIGWFALATLAYGLALLAKPTATALPLVALVLELAVLRRPLRRFGPGVLLWIALAGAMVLVTRSGSGSSKLVDLPLWGRPFIVGDALAFYLGKLLFPASIGIDYGRHPSLVLGSWWGYATWLIPAALGVLLWRLRLRWAGIGVLLFIAAALPILGFVPFYLHHISTVGDRYLYLPLIGPALVVTYMLCRVSPTRRGVALAVAGALLLGCAVQSYRLTGYWRESVAMLTHTLSINPRSYYAWNNLGSAHNRRGEADKAIKAYQKALEIDPNRPGTHYNLGTALAKQGDLAGGIRHLREALRQLPDYPDAHNNLGLILQQQGRRDEAISHFREALRLRPDYTPAQANLEQALRMPATTTAAASAPGKASAAQKAADAAAKANLQGLEKGRAGDLPGALAAFDEAIRLRPDYAEAHYNRGLTLDRQGRATEALTAYEAAVRAQPDYPEARMNLGVAYARQERWDSAEEHLAEAVRLRPGWPAAEQALALVRQQKGQAPQP